MAKSLVLKVLDKRNNLSKISLLASRFSLLASRFYVFRLASSTSHVSAQVIIKEKVEINPQVILSDSPTSGNEHVFTYTLTWSPTENYRGRIYLTACNLEVFDTGYLESGFCTLTITGNGRHNVVFEEQRWGYNANNVLGWWGNILPGRTLKAYIDGVDQNHPQDLLGRTDGLNGLFNLNIGGSISQNNDAALSINAIQWAECNVPGWYNTDPFILQIIQGSEYVTLYDINNQIELGGYVQLNSYTEISNIRLQEKQTPSAATTTQTIRLEANINGVTVNSETEYYPKINNEPNEIDVLIIPSTIAQGDTARVVLKKKANNILQDFATDKLFNVEIIEGVDYGWILDSLSNDTLTTFENILQGFKIIAKDSTGLDSTKIRIKVTTEDDGIPVARMIKNNTTTNSKEIAQTKTESNDDETILPDWIVPGGPILIEGFGDLVVKEDECDEEIVVCENLEPQTHSQSAFEEVHSNIDWNWIDENGTPKSTNVGDGCSYMPPNDPNELEFGKVYFMEIIGTEYEALDDMIVKACLDESDPENKKWRFNLSNIRIPIMNTLCLAEPKNRNWTDLGDGTNTTLLENHVFDCLSFGILMRSLQWQIEGGYLQQAQGIPLEFAVYSSIAVKEHEDEHVRQLKRIITEKMNQKHFPDIRQFFTLLQSEYPCPEDAVDHYKNTFKTLLKSYFNDYNNLEYWLKPDKESGVPNSELEADRAAYQTYVDIYNAIYDWVVPPDPQRFWYDPLEPGCLGIRRIEEGE